MQIKCPGCSKVLNIPATAAGKVVKCPCGKQLRAPAGSGAANPTAGSAANRPAVAAKPAAQRTSPARPAPARTSGSAGDFDASMLDELTDQDQRPVKTAGQSAARQATGSGKKKKDALAGAAAELKKERAKSKSEFRTGAAKEVYSSIGILLFLGVLRLGFNIYFLMNVEAEVDALGGDPGFEGDDMDLLLTLVRSYYIINIVIGALFVTCAALIFKFPMTCAFTAMVTFVIAEIIGLILNPLALFSIGGWVARAAIFGGLVQTVNNASYYKFVKSGGRDGS